MSKKVILTKIFLSVNIIYFLSVWMLQMIMPTLKLAIMSFSLVSIIIVNSKTVYVLDVLAEDVSNDKNDTSNQQKSSDSGLENMRYIAQFKPEENEFLANDGYYQVEKFDFVASNGSEICPLNNCIYSVENTEFRPNSPNAGYIFEGRLTVTTIEYGIKKSEFYYFNVVFDKKSEEERTGTNIQFLEATSGLGKFNLIPGFDYNIANATLRVDKKNPSLTIYGERTH
jgi:hypothetical protein